MQFRKIICWIFGHRLEDFKSFDDRQQCDRCFEEWFRPAYDFISPGIEKVV